MKALAMASSKDKAENSRMSKFTMMVWRSHKELTIRIKRLEADECRKIVDTILKRDLDASDFLDNNVKVSHELSTYGFSDREWGAYLLYLVNMDPKK